MNHFDTKETLHSLVYYIGTVITADQVSRVPDPTDVLPSSIIRDFLNLTGVLSMAGTNSILGGGGFHHVAIRVRDFNRTISFYTEVVGFLVKFQWGESPKRAALLDTGDGNYLEVFERPAQPPAPAYANGSPEEPALLHVAFRTTCLDAAVQRLREAGALITLEPTSIDLATRPTGPTPIRIAFFRGPDGELVELFQNELT